MFTNTRVFTLDGFSTIEGTYADIGCTTNVTNFFQGDEEWTVTRIHATAAPTVGYFPRDGEHDPVVVVRLGDCTSVFLSPEQTAHLVRALCAELDNRTTHQVMNDLPPVESVV